MDALAPMDAETRHRRLLDALARSGYQPVSALAKSLRVSEMTIRRDLDALDKRGLIKRTYGGAVGQGGQDLSIDYSGRRREHAPAKARIAARALTQIRDGQTLYLDAGTTALALAEALPPRGFTVITPSLPVANALSVSRDLTVHVLGGEFRPDLQAMVGPQTAQALAAFRPDVAFLGATAVDLSRGLSRATIEEIPLKCQAARQSERVIVLATREKLGPNAGMVYLTCDEIDLVITETAEGAEEIRVPSR
ncbi:MAG TPA: DeoR/GlpR family DNA-binding transcription regulator [Planctomycetota bacterium]|nr:DeoR/GlpR family DNA-binding transcription regulator [Planctomycetota bacterium]